MIEPTIAHYIQQGYFLPLRLFLFWAMLLQQDLPFDSPFIMQSNN